MMKPWGAQLSPSNCLDSIHKKGSLTIHILLDMLTFNSQKTEHHYREFQTKGDPLFILAITLKFVQCSRTG